MIVACKACGADLRVNRNLAGTAIACPECGERLTVPESAPRAPQSRREPVPRSRPAAPRLPPMSLSLFGAQTVLVLLAVRCLAGGLFQKSWSPPPWSYLHANPMLLVAVGVGLLLAAGVSRRFPIAATLSVVVLILVACTLHYRFNRTIDASRVLALSLSMVALWLAMEHRGVT